MSNKQRVYARNLQYLCVTVLFKLVSSAFLEKYSILDSIIGPKIEKYDLSKNVKKLHPWKHILPKLQENLSKLFLTKEIQSTFPFKRNNRVVFLQHIRYLMYVESYQYADMPNCSVRKSYKKLKCTQVSFLAMVS